MQVTGTFFEGGRFASYSTEARLEFFCHFAHFCRDDYPVVHRLVCHLFYHFVYHALYLAALLAGLEVDVPEEELCLCIHLKVADDLSAW
jgi:hypothetical protein